VLFLCECVTYTIVLLFPCECVPFALLSLFLCECVTFARSAISVPNLQKLNARDMCARMHAAAARLQLQWMCGLVTDVGFKRVVQLLLYFVQAVLNS